MIDGLVNSGAIPVLEASLRFAAGRQTLLAHNIANIDTPDFRPMDVSTADFQRALGEAIDARRARGLDEGDLPFENTREVARHADGTLTLTPRTGSGSILFHDRNNRDLERMMQDLAENVGAFRVASDLLRHRFEHLRSAIGERV